VEENKMQLEKIVEIIERIVPQPRELDFDRLGVISDRKDEIQNIGVCVDLTSYVLEQSTRLGVDFLLIHHGRWRGSADGYTEA
jgi:putative NIF3 family GTP cyclohydrolase 1 type 2